MYYNMGDYSEDGLANSILSNKEGVKYLVKANEYPLSLDMALPVYLWSVVFRNKIPVDILHKTGSAQMDSLKELKQFRKDLYYVQSPLYFHGSYLQPGDLIKCEMVSGSELKRSAEILSQNFKKENRSIVYFELDEKYLQNFSPEELLAVVHSCN